MQTQGNFIYNDGDGGPRRPPVAAFSFPRLRMRIGLSLAPTFPHPDEQSHGSRGEEQAHRPRLGNGNGVQLEGQIFTENALIPSGPSMLSTL